MDSLVTLMTYNYLQINAGWEVLLTPPIPGQANRPGRSVVVAKAYQLPLFIVPEKACKRCGEAKPLSAFGCDVRMSDGLRAECRPCYNTFVREWRRANAEIIEARRRNRWANDPEYRERVRARKKDYYTRNREKMVAATGQWQRANRDRVNASQSKRKKLNPDPVRNATMLRRCRIKGVFVEKVDRRIVFDRDKGICHLCRMPVDPKNWHVDHLIPISRGGPHSYENVAVAHPQCNMARNNKLLSEIQGWIT